MEDPQRTNTFSLLPMGGILRELMEVCIVRISSCGQPTNQTFSGLSSVTYPSSSSANHPSCRIFPPTGIPPRNHYTAEIKPVPPWIVSLCSKVTPKFSYSAEAG